MSTYNLNNFFSLLKLQQPYLRTRDYIVLHHLQLVRLLLMNNRLQIVICMQTSRPEYNQILVKKPGGNDFWPYYQNLEEVTNVLLIKQCVPSFLASKGVREFGTLPLTDVQCVSLQGFCLLSRFQTEFFCSVIGGNQVINISVVSLKSLCQDLCEFYCQINVMDQSL